MIPSTLKKLSTGSYFLAFFVLGLFSALLGPTLPLLAKQLQVPLGGMGILFSSGALGYLTGSLFGGRLFDRFPGHPILAGSLLLIAFVVASIPFIPFLGALILIIYTMGCLKGCIDVGGNTLLIWMYQDGLSSMMNALHMLFAFGAFICPLMIAPLLNGAEGMTIIFPLIASGAIPAGIAFLFLASPARQSNVIRSEKAALTSKRMGVMVNPPGLPILIMSLAFFFYVGVEVSYGGWLASYVIRKGFGTEQTGAYLTSIYWGFFLCGRIAAIFIGKKMRPSRVLLLDLAGAFLAVFLLVVFPGSLWVLVLASAIMGISIASIFPTFLLYAENRMALTGSITRWFFIGASSGAMFLPFAIGQLFELMDPGIFAFCLLINLAGTLIMVCLFDQFSGEKSATENSAY